MPTHGLVELREVVAMLEHCAPGSTWKLHGEHRVFFSWQEREALVPCGSHHDRGKRQSRAEIERGNVKKLIRALNVPRPCAEEWLPIFRGQLVK